MAVYLSGIQPSGSSLHLGNYIGALLNWKNIIKNSKDGDKFYFMLADLHTMTSKKNAEELKKNIISLVATYVACGITPSEKIVFFQQSKIPAHCELCWILSTITPLGQLERMTQFKDKKGKLSTDEINAGLLYYPILMAADILLYKTNFVPVGEDQTQHIEFTRDLVERFDRLYNSDIFIMPEGLIDKTSKRIMSLGDGSKKMSKSIGEERDRIFLTDTDEQIAKKIKSAKTDSIMGIFYDKDRLEVNNLINIYSAISGGSIEEISGEYKDKNTKQFKDDLTDLVINAISPIREKLQELEQDTDFLKNIIEKGSFEANNVASKTLLEVKKAVGLM